MIGTNCLNLYLDAGISNRRDQERYTRFIDAALAEEGITMDDIVGVAEGFSNDLYIVHRQAIILVSEFGIFNKRIEVKRQCPLASIARLRATREGFKGSDITVTGNDAQGDQVFRAEWSYGGPDWVAPLIERQRQQLFDLISKAMDQLGGNPRRPSVSSAWSKAGALMDWAADVVRAAGVEVTAERVEEHANMIGSVIGLMVFLPLARLDKLSALYPDGELPPGKTIERFDDYYRRVVARVGSAQPVDTGIDEYLAGSWNEYVRGCRETYA